MNFFSTVLAVAGCVAAAHAQFAYGGQRVGTTYSTNHVTYGAAPFATSTRVVAAPLATSARLVAAPVATAGVVATPVARAAVAAPARPPKVHEIHTQSGQQRIRVEEFQAPNQLIRVHEAAQAPPEVLHVRAPSSQQSVVRVVSHSSGPAHVERVVHPAPGVQVVDVHRPPPPPARIVQIVRGPAPHPQILFHQEHEGPSEIRVEAPPQPAPIVAPAVHAAPVVAQAVHASTVVAAPAVHAGPVVGAVASPVVHTVAAPALRAVAASAPVAQTVRVSAVPVGVGYTMYGVGYGRLYSGHFASSRASS